MPTTYKITFDTRANATATYSDENAQAALWKTEEVSDKIMIKCMGRNIYNSSFKKHMHITYLIYDYLVPVQQRRKPLEVVVKYRTVKKDASALDENIETDVVDTVVVLKRNRIRPSEIIHNAVIAADREYTKVGGGVHCTDRLHQHTDIVACLFQEIELCTIFQKPLP